MSRSARRNRDSGCPKSSTWPAYLSVETAARFLDCSPNHVRNLLKRGLPSITLGRARRIARVDLETWIRRHTESVHVVDQVLVELRNRTGRSLV
ncbi:MAG TPA: helix-turn-helix domain-containing protein [Myxococcota bacterium]|nr:helix-turn-helix domain-containing protein [Myxococcota bacterium]